jgi:hypothetical protein
MSSTPSPLPRPERAVIGFFLYVTSIFTFGKIDINKIIFILFSGFSHLCTLGLFTE